MGTHEMSITDAEILADFTEAMELDDIVDDPAAVTINQLVRVFGCKRMAAKARAEKAVGAGTLERVKVRRQCPNGLRVLIAYRTPDRATIVPEAVESRHDMRQE